MSDVSDLDGGGAQPSAPPSPQPNAPDSNWARDRADQQRPSPSPPRRPQAANPNARTQPAWSDGRDSQSRHRLASEARAAVADHDAGAAGDDRGGVQTSPTPAPSEKISIDGREYDPQEVHDAVAARAAEQGRALSRPQTTDGFELKQSQNFKPPAGLDFKLDPDDPAVAMYREFALKNEFTQDQFSEGLDLVASLRVGEAHAISKAKRAEVEKLGAAATARVDAVTTWLNAMTGDKGAAMVRVLQMCPVATTIEAFESLIQRFTSQGGGSYSPTGRRVETPDAIPGYDGMSFEQRRQAQDRLKGR